MPREVRVILNLSCIPKVLGWPGWLAAACFAMAPVASAQGPTPPPGANPSPAPPPPREVPLVEKKWDELPAGSQANLSDLGKKALAIDPAKWRHAETPNFILHYRRVTEAQKVAREVEFNLWFIANALGASKDRYLGRSHAYVFEDAEEWKRFVALSPMPEWTTSFAFGDELFLNVRRDPGTGSFDSQTLAHETAHAVVARLYPGKEWPLWLSEGFAEYMGGASVAARKSQTTRRFQSRLEQAEMPLGTLAALADYPKDRALVRQLYQTSEKFVRFLMNELPKDRIAGFIDAVLAGKGMERSVLEVYPDHIRDWRAFEKRYERFTR
jgi:hypothetical protein